MANPLPNENEIYEKIKKESITVDPLIWELLSHNIRNDIHCISLSLGGLRTHPQWILKFVHINLYINFGCFSLNTP